jgi:hypothetical protein
MHFFGLSMNDRHVQMIKYTLLFTNMFQSLFVTIFRVSYNNNVTNIQVVL